MNNGRGDTDFQVGEIVLVRDGPFAGFSGTVVEVRRQVLHLDVSVFGLPTRIEVAVANVDRAADSTP
jgi:transcription antitermination factor NusG